MDAGASGVEARDPGGVVVDCRYYDSQGRRPGPLTLAEAGELARAGDGWVWVGVHDPLEVDVEAVAREFGLPPLAVEDAIKAHQRPKLEVYGDVVFAVVKPIAYVGYSDIDVSEVAAFVGSHFFVTVRHGASEVLDDVRRTMDERPVAVDDGPVVAFYEVLDHIVDRYELAVQTLESDIDDLEAEVFGDGDEDNSAAIYELKRDAAVIRRALVPLSGPAERLARREIDAFPPGPIAEQYRDVYDHVLRSTESLEAADRTLSDMLQAELGRVSVRQAEISLRQNEDMRKISAWAGIAVVPATIGAIYGMNFRDMPELRWQYGYAVAVGTMVLGCLALFKVFRTRGWL
ncbi:MAG: magnesium and cobalt transport protein CorA [Actinobacteria bacterium]|nr:magnesium and cobalt transport protein CorA [Actinomycetota bacterium]